MRKGKDMRDNMKGGKQGERKILKIKVRVRRGRGNKSNQKRKKKCSLKTRLKKEERF